MKPHKYAEWIKAKADGHEIQYNAISNNGAEDGWCDMHDSDWVFNGNFDYRIKPAAPKWPETTMTYEDMREAYLDVAKKDCATSTWHSLAAQNIANAALRHACETGQLVLPDPDRDMKIAKAAWIAGVNSESSNDLESIIKEATK